MIPVNAESNIKYNHNPKHAVFALENFLKWLKILCFLDLMNTNWHSEQPLKYDE